MAPFPSARKLVPRRPVNAPARVPVKYDTGRSTAITPRNSFHSLYTGNARRSTGTWSVSDISTDAAIPPSGGRLLARRKNGACA